MKNLVEILANKVNCSMFDVEQLLMSWVNDDANNHTACITKLKLKYGVELMNERTRQLAQLKWEVAEYKTTKHLLEIISQRDKELSIMFEYLGENRFPPIEDVSYELLALDLLKFNWFKFRFQIDMEILGRIRQKLIILERKLTKQASSIFMMQRFLQLSIINETEEYAFLRTLTDRGFM